MHLIYKRMDGREKPMDHGIRRQCFTYRSDPLVPPPCRSRTTENLCLHFALLLKRGGGIWLSCLTQTSPYGPDASLEHKEDSSPRINICRPVILPRETITLVHHPVSLLRVWQGRTQNLLCCLERRSRSISYIQKRIKPKRKLVSFLIKNYLGAPG